MSSKCPRCNKTVYFAEEVRALSKAWHKRCLSCEECNKTLNPASLCDNDGHVFCTPCYGKKLGPKGYGYGGGAGVLSTNNYVGTPSPSKKQDNTKVVTSSSPKKRCPNCKIDKEGKFCDSCGTKLGSPPSIPSPREVSPRNTATKTTKSLSRFGGGDKCIRCSKTVYAMEKVVSLSSIFHKQCFKCANCSQSLNTNTVCDKDGEVYCKPCYGKLYGPKGYGYGVGAGVLGHTE